MTFLNRIKLTAKIVKKEKNRSDPADKVPVLVYLIQVVEGTGSRKLQDRA